MNLWRISGICFLVAALVCAATHLPIRAQGPETKVELKLKCFEPKEKVFYQKLETKTTQNMKVMGQEMNQEQKQIFIISWTPKDMKDGFWVVEQKIEDVKMDINIGTTKIAYDSSIPAAQQPNNPMTEFFKSLMEVKLTLHIDPKTLQVKKVEGRDTFVTKLGESHPQLKNLLKSILGEKAIEQMAQQTWGVVPVPPEAKKVKDTWTGKSTVELGPIGTYNNEYAYTLDGLEKDSKDVWKIGVKPTVTYKPPTTDDKSEGGLPFKIKGSSNLKSDAASAGTVWFDNKLGRIAKSEMNLEVKGEVYVDISGIETRVELNQKQKSTLTTYDTKPELKTDWK